MNDSKSSSNPSKDIGEFVRLLSENQQKLFRYLMSLLHDRNVVDDVLQETNLVLWREFASFELGTIFTAWSFRVAFFQVQAWRKKQQRDRILFSDEFLQAISEELAADTDYADQQIEALENCLGHLPDHHRQLVQHHYTACDAVPEIAARMDRSADAVYRMLSRIRHTLFDCVTQSLYSKETS